MSGKFGDLIRKAREQEPEARSQEPEDQNAVIPESQKAGITEKQFASKTENQKTEPEITQVVEKPKDVNLTIKVSETLRRHWAAESKRVGISMTAVIIDALTKKFGKPEG
jgi:hypothetical protein